MLKGPCGVEVEWSMTTTILTEVGSTAEVQSPKSRIADLKLHRRTSPTVSPQVATKGGEGGGGGEPPLPVSNAKFVADVIRGVATDATAVVCSKVGDPTGGDWPAAAARDVDAQCPASRNNYFNCSSFNIADDGSVHARKDGFSAFHFLLLDDVGTKVPLERLDGFQATWRLETSPGNFQVGMRLTEPLRDQEAVTRLQAAVVSAGLCDPGAKGVARWARLPQAVNGKAKHCGASGDAFRCRLTEYNPDVAYTPAELIERLGLTPAVKQGRTADAASSVRCSNEGNVVFTPAPMENPVVSALKQNGLHKGHNGSGCHDVTCPWVEEHTDAIDSGAAYFEPSPAYPGGGFVCHHSHGDRYHLSELLKFLDVSPDAARGKARIDIVPGEMNLIRDAAERSLAALGGFYQSGGAIVVIRTDPSTGDIGLEQVTEPALTAALSSAADWFKYDGRSSKMVRCDPPARNVMQLLRAQEFGHLPVLKGLTRQPYFREQDGTLVTQLGYDPVSGLFSAYEPKAFAIPAPTEADARQALAKLEELVSEYRFAGEADRSAAICAMLTGSVRPSLPTAPAFNITASTPGSGKSYLASTITPFAGPGIPLKVSYPTTADEASKAMLSTFLGGPAAVVFDDMQGPWKPFGAMNRALTSDTMTDRVLGASRTITVSTRSLILGTGNNVGPVQDMTRRVVTIRLHHKTATPALETYVGKPAETVARNRPEYVVAALTIIAAYRAAGSPKASVPDIASYNEWSDMCRQPLLWLGLTDPASSLIDQVRHDPDQDDLGQLLAAWYASVGDKPITVRELVLLTLDDPSIEDALLDLPVCERDVVNRSKLGWYLKRHANRVVGGYELQAAVCVSRRGWRVVKVDPAGD